MKKRFTKTLNIPHVWRSLLQIESFDDLSPFLEPTPPTEAIEADGLTRADWSRPIRHDRRQVSFKEDGHVVSLELISGNENYFTVPSLQLPNGDRYARPEVEFEIPPEETLEVQGVAEFVWRQQLT